jgi:predicted secreted hydrolase
MIAIADNLESTIRTIAVRRLNAVDARVWKFVDRPPRRRPEQSQPHEDWRGEWWCLSLCLTDGWRFVARRREKHELLTFVSTVSPERIHA